MSLHAFDRFRVLHALSRYTQPHHKYLSKEAYINDKRMQMLNTYRICRHNSFLSNPVPNLHALLTHRMHVLHHIRQHSSQYAVWKNLPLGQRALHPLYMKYLDSRFRECVQNVQSFEVFEEGFAQALKDTFTHQSERRAYFSIYKQLMGPTLDKEVETSFYNACVHTDNLVSEQLSNV
jgi:hypothetical protein